MRINKAFKTAVCLVIFASALMGCHSNKERCDYDIQEIQAKVIDIVPVSEENGSTEEQGKEHNPNYRVIMEFNTSVLSEEPQELGKLLKKNTDSLFVARNKIKIGLIYTGSVSELVSGDCQVIYQSFNHRFD